MERVDKYIEEQLKIEPSPFLKTRVLAAIDSEKSKKTTPWYRVAVVMAAAVVTALALFVGSTLSFWSNQVNEGLIVNDYYLEQLSNYVTNENE